MQMNRLPAYGRLVGSLAVLIATFAPTVILAQSRSPFGLGPAAKAPPVSGLVAWILQQQAAFHKALTAAISAVETSPAAFFTLIGLAFAYGVLHAIGPGHGKAVIASYLVANERAMKRGIALAFGAAGVQALVALGVVGLVAGMMNGTAAMMTQTVAIVEKAGFSLIVAMGVWVLWRKARQLASTRSDAACLDDTCGHDHGGDPRVLAEASPRALIFTAIGAGIRPCTGAIILLVFALSKGLWLAGALSVVAMAVGTAIGTSLFAALAVKAKVLALGMISGRGERWRRLGLLLEMAAGLALVLLGLALLLGSSGGN
jgi:nickel/cobalt transporter (NicO) family protein